MKAVELFTPTLIHFDNFRKKKRCFTLMSFEMTGINRASQAEYGRSIPFNAWASAGLSNSGL